MFLCFMLEILKYQEKMRGQMSYYMHGKNIHIGMIQTRYNTPLNGIYPCQSPSLRVYAYTSNWKLKIFLFTALTKAVCEISFFSLFCSTILNHKREMVILSWSNLLFSRKSVKRVSSYHKLMTSVMRQSHSIMHLSLIGVIMSSSLPGSLFFPTPPWVGEGRGKRKIQTLGTRL